MPVIEEITEGVRFPVKIWTDEIDENTKQQLCNVAQLPFIHHHVAAMPGVHLGIGATIGSVIATQKAIIPAAVGVDIGCGMIAARLSLTANELDKKNLKKIYNQINRDVPVGFDEHDENHTFIGVAKPFEAGLESLIKRHPDLLKPIKKKTKWINQLGTLGSGNHFIELCLDEHDFVWIMIHSGSRGIGNAIATYFIKLAIKDMASGADKLPDRNLSLHGHRPFAK